MKFIKWNLFLFDKLEIVLEPIFEKLLADNTGFDCKFIFKLTFIFVGVSSSQIPRTTRIWAEESFGGGSESRNCETESN